ncbi:hypothetical protein FPV67DRAFT_1653999 [Lyophyllum atratum]|nr:hypothetical protein FPV67DRAFT_1653999 [Lyophyllum atratum]
MMCTRTTNRSTPVQVRVEVGSVKTWGSRLQAIPAAAVVSQAPPTPITNEHTQTTLVQYQGMWGLLPYPNQQEWSPGLQTQRQKEPSGSGSADPRRVLMLGSPSCSRWRKQTQRRAKDTELPETIPEYASPRTVHQRRNPVSFTKPATIRVPEVYLRSCTLRRVAGGPVLFGRERWWCRHGTTTPGEDQESLLYSALDRLAKFALSSLTKEPRIISVAACGGQWNAGWGVGDVEIGRGVLAEVRINVMGFLSAPAMYHKPTQDETMRWYSSALATTVTGVD